MVTANDSGTSPLPKWEFAPETQELSDDDYIDLEIIDLAAFHGLEGDASQSTEAKAVQDDLTKRAMDGFKTTGAIVLTGHGLAAEDIHHHFNLGKMFCDEVPDVEKRRLECRHAETGTWSGYKPRGYYNRPNGVADVQEHFGFYPDSAVRSRLPLVARPYITDFRKFMEHNHYEILRKVLGIISMGLGLPVDTLWNLHHHAEKDDDRAVLGNSDAEFVWRHSKDHFRYGMYSPPTEESSQKSSKLWLSSHTDLGSVAFIYSQPIAGLQVFTPEREWRYVRYYPNSIIVNLGDVMEFVTGGVLKAIPHRVLEPPPDQRHLRRLGLFYFVPFLPGVPLTPLDYPSLYASGAKNMFRNYFDSGGKPLVASEWMAWRGKLIGGKHSESSHEDSMAENQLRDLHHRYFISPPSHPGVGTSNSEKHAKTPFARRPALGRPRQIGHLPGVQQSLFGSVAFQISVGDTMGRHFRK